LQAKTKHKAAGQAWARLPSQKKKVKKLWAIAQKIYGRGKEQKIYALIDFVYQKQHLRELTDSEISELIAELTKILSEQECPQAPGEWRVIKALQRQLGWTDEHLINFIQKVTGISHPRFLEYKTSRAVINALRKTKRRLS
jgi:NADH:ubiquinone oxidoreductase subunit E